NVEAAGVPEAACAGDEAIVGRIDENLDVHAATVLVEVVIHHATDVEVAKVHRRTDFQRADIVRLEMEGSSWPIVGDLRWFFQAREGALGRQAVVSGGRCCVDGDIHPRQEGSEPRDAAERQTRPHY